MPPTSWRSSDALVSPRFFNLNSSKMDSQIKARFFGMHIGCEVLWGRKDEDLLDILSSAFLIF